MWIAAHRRRHCLAVPSGEAVLGCRSALKRVEQSSESAYYPYHLKLIPLVAPTHVFCALRAFMHLELNRSRGLIASWYDFKRHFADQAITNFIRWLRECAQQGAEGLVTKCSLFFR